MTMPTNHAVAPHTPPPPNHAADARGHLSIADRVIEKIAAHAVAEVDRATGVPRRVLGMAVGASDQARVRARVHGDAATVEVSMSVDWPAPVPEVATQVRSHLRERLMTLAGLATAQIDIEITGLNRPESPRKGRVS